MATKVKDISISTPIYRASLSMISTYRVKSIKRRFENKEDENYSTFDIDISYEDFKGVRGDSTEIGMFTTDLNKAKDEQRDMIKRHLDEARTKYEKAQKEYLDLIEKFRVITNFGVPNE